MAKRNFRQSADDPFGNENPSIDTSPQSIANKIYGSPILGDLAAVDARNERIQMLNIFDIEPDPAQPRRVIPTVIRERWDGTPTGVKDMFMLWWGAVNNERAGDNYHEELNLGAYLESNITDRSETDNLKRAAGSLETSFMKIDSLAASIRHKGLTNPITVASTGGRYQLETGERRWLAYHLLYAWFNADGVVSETDNWEKIPSRQVSEVDVWRQANENNARADLNAIGKARQYAVLMLDLHNSDHFKPIESFKSERQYYSQVKDLSVPYGKGEQLLNAMGVSSRSALTRYRKLLDLPDEIWRGGDDYNLSEEILAKLAKLPAQEAIEEFRRIVLGQNDSQDAVIDIVEDDYAPGTKRHFSTMTRSITKAGPGKHKFNARALTTLRELRQWLDDQEQRIMNFID
jgi:hypothetical protein